MDLARPVFMAILAEGVDKRKQLRFFGGRTVRFAAGTKVRGDKLVIFFRLIDEQQQLIHVRRVDALLVAHSARQAPHAEKLSSQGRGRFADQRHSQGSLLAGLKFDRAVETVVDAVCAGIIHSAMQRQCFESRDFSDPPPHKKSPLDPNDPAEL